MFDFEAITRAGNALETGLRDLDSRLEQIANLQRILIALTAMALATARDQHPDDVMAQAHALAADMSILTRDASLNHVRDAS